jgi:hypothetical protein
MMFKSRTISRRESSSIAPGTFVAAALFVGLSQLILSSTAGAASAPNTYKLSGSGKGTLTNGPSAVCLAGVEAGGTIELNGLVGSISGYSTVASWTIVINENKNGTFKIKTASTKDPKVALNLSLKDHNVSQGDKESLDGTSGTVTVHGQSGSLDATMRNLTSTGYGNTLQISGRWSCPASGG